jgi:hypothetical protein
MEQQLNDISAAIGWAAVNKKGEIVALLTRNGVIVPTETLTDKMLVELTVNALAESQSFAKDFTAWAANQATTYSNANGPIGPTLPDGSFESGGDGFNWGKALEQFGKLGASALNYVSGRQQVTAANALSQAEQARLEAERLRAEQQDKSFAQQLRLGTASTTRVVIIGLLALGVVGGAIYFFTRKK